MRAKYRIPRENVYVGQVARIGDTYDNLKITGYMACGVDYRIMVSTSILCRSMLFTIDKDNLAHDLLYATPNYPIMDWANPDMVNSDNHNNSGIIIRSICHLDPLLKHFRYPQMLTHDDVLTIRRKFFNGHFALQHYELFGYKHVKRSFMERLDDYEREFDADNSFKKRFARDDEASYILPPEYFDILDRYGDLPFTKSFALNRPMNSFKPSELEGKIKKLLP